MEMKFIQDSLSTDKCYPYAVTDVTGESFASSRILDLKLTILTIIDDLGTGIPVSEIAAGFHNRLTEMIINVAQYVGEKQAVLTGGCFQNKTLLERTILRLQMEGFDAY